MRIPFKNCVYKRPLNVCMCVNAFSGFPREILRIPLRCWLVVNYDESTSRVDVLGGVQSRSTLI